MATRKITIEVQQKFEGDHSRRLVTAFTGPTVADLSKALVRSLKIPRTKEAWIWFQIENAGLGRGRIVATFPEEARSLVRKAFSPSLVALWPGLHSVHNLKLVRFVAEFNSRSVFGTEPGAVYREPRHWASLEERQEEQLLHGFRELSMPKRKLVLGAIVSARPAKFLAAARVSR